MIKICVNLSRKFLGNEKKMWNNFLSHIDNRVTGLRKHSEQKKMKEIELVFTLKGYQEAKP